jgi:hypothetical protein
VSKNSVIVKAHMANPGLKIPLSGYLAARACVGTYSHLFHLPQRQPRRSRNGAGCVFKTAAVNCPLLRLDLFTSTCSIERG